MAITVDNQTNTKEGTFSDLEVCDCFKWRGGIFIKVNLDENISNCINLNAEQMFKLNSDERVVSIDLKITALPK